MTTPVPVRGGLRVLRDDEPTCAAHGEHDGWGGIKGRTTQRLLAIP